MRLLIVLAAVVAARGLLLRRRVRPERVRQAGFLAAVALGAALLLDAACRLAGQPADVARGALGVGAVVVVAALFAPAVAPPPGDAVERAAVAALVAGPDADTLAPFALRRDRAYAWSPDGRAAVAYRVLAGTAVAGGDPVGWPGAHRAAADAFRTLCARNGWRVAVLGASDAGRQLWPGLRGIGIGDEAVVDVPRFALAGRPMRNARQAVARTHNAGVTTVLCHQADLAPAVRAELAALVARWPGHERGFSMNLDALTAGAPDTGPDRPDCLLAIARDRSGAVVGFQRYARCAAGGILTLDAMPRLRGAPNGVNERLIADTIAYAGAHGVDRISLNFAAFRALLESRSRTGRERLGYHLLRLLDPLIKVEPLYRFNAKFAPAWQPRSVLIGSPAAIGWVLLAALGMEFALPYDRAHASRRRPGELPAPRVPRRAGRRADQATAAER